MGSISSYEFGEEDEEVQSLVNYDIDAENIEIEVVAPKPRTFGDIEVKKDTPKEKEVLWNIPNCSILPRYSPIDAPVFTFLNVRWFLQINPRDTKSFEDVALNLRMDDVELAFNMLCTFSIIKDDSSVKTVTLKRVFNIQNLKLTDDQFFTRSVLWARNSELMSSGKLIIMCNLKQLPHPTKLTELHLLSEDVKSLFTGGEFCDITLRVKDIEFKAHKIILAARSPVFASYFKNEAWEKQQNTVVDIPDCDPDSFPEFLEYLYSGRLENISVRSALNLYKTANKYDVPALKLFCVEHMEQNLNMEYFFDVLYLTELNDEKNLFNIVQQFFNRNLNKIFTASEWKDLMTNNSNLANKLLMEMSSDVQVVTKRRRLR